MINSYRSYPVPPQAPVFRAPMAPPLALQAPMRLPVSPVPRVANNDAWDPLGELAFTLVGTPLAAIVGAGIGFAIAGPVGAARGAILGASAPGGFFASREMLLHPWWKPGPNATGGTVVAAMAAFPLLSVAGYAIGTAFGGPVGAAWGAMLAAVAPVGVWFVAQQVHRLFFPPTFVYGPGAPVAPAPPKV
jgi:hypothetical protein